jgi:hypothetical protein
MEAPARLAGFSPSDIPNLALWLDASDANSFFDATSGGSEVTSDAASVARWEDKSGNARHFTQSTAGERPALAVAAVNGRNALYSSGGTGAGSKWMTGPTTTGLFNGNEFTALFVFRPQTNAINAVQMREAGGNIQFGQCLAATNPANYRVSINQSGGIAIDSASGLAQGSVHAILTRCKRNSTFASGNGCRVAYGGGTEVGVDRTDTALSIGTNFNLGGSQANTKLASHYCELLVWTSFLTTAQSNQLGAYVVSKWGAGWTNIS